MTLVSLWLLRYVEDRLPRLAYKHVTIVDALARLPAVQHIRVQM